MNRIDNCFKHSTQKILSPYITAGFPTIESTVDIMHALVDGGADIIELGMPFSDPFAEGVVIQKAMEKALENGVTVDLILKMVQLFRENDNVTPVILMGYLNPIEQYGYEKFAKNCQASGVDGTILVDLPPEEASSMLPFWEKYTIYPIFLCSPTTSDVRLSLINTMGRGYVYYISMKGITGNALELNTTLKQDYLVAKHYIDKPVLVGFGIKTPDMAQTIASFADGVVVGAALISTIQHAHENNLSILAEVTSFVASLRQSIHLLEQK
jgi:tryptophan synthase alpha chain